MNRKDQVVKFNIDFKIKEIRKKSFAASMELT